MALGIRFRRGKSTGNEFNSLNYASRFDFVLTFHYFATAVNKKWRFGELQCNNNADEQST